jgi:peroxiredoxin
MPSKDTMKLMKTSNNSDVLTISNQNLVFLTFLRHFGCVFCRESLIDISERKQKMEKDGIVPIFVHMSEPEIADQYFDKYGLKGAIHVSDIDRVFYLAFGLTRGRFNQLFGLKTALRGFEVSVKKNIYPTLAQIGDGFQMPGIFMIRNGIIEEKFIHQYAAHKPDYDTLFSCCTL